MAVERVVPPRIFRLTFRLADGRSYWRYIRCPYKTRSPEDWADSLEGMQKKLAELVLAERLTRFTVSRVPSDRVAQARDKTHRWSEVLPIIDAA